MPEREEVIERILTELSQEEISEDHIELCEDLLEDNYRSLEHPVDEIKLDELQVENFRVIEDKHIDFDPQSSVLFGKNKRGKTTLLEAIRFNLLGLQEKQRIRLADPIRDEKSVLGTNGIWTVDDERYLIRRILRNGSSYSETVRSNRNPQAIDDLSFGSPDSQESVSRDLGLWSVESKQLGRYNTFSLFHLMQGKFKTFLEWREKDDFLDILFGIDLASVTMESERYREDEIKISDEEKTASEDLKDVESTLSTLRAELDEFQNEKEGVDAKWTDRQSELRRVRGLIEDKEELTSLESQETDIKRQINKLREERRTQLDDLRTVEQRISHYQEMDMGEHLHEPSQQLQQYMNVPDRCPICTNKVENYQRERLHNDQECPLCGKEVPEKRIERGSERDVEEKILERENQQEVLEEAQEERQRIVGEIDLLESRIQDYEEELQNIRDQIQGSDEKQLQKRRDELEETIGRLDRKSTDLQSKINANLKDIDGLEERHDILEDLYQSRKEKVEKIDSLKTFEKVVKNQINRERQEILNDLERTMENILELFEEGTFSSAFDVDFKSNSGYKFVMRVKYEDDIPSDRANENSNEGKLTALLFHTAILKQLTRHGDAYPLRLFMIDSPYSEAPDIRNAPDITQFLKQLPSILPDYQIILGVADTALSDRDSFISDYSVIDL